MYQPLLDLAGGDRASQSALDWLCCGNNQPPHRVSHNHKDLLLAQVRGQLGCGRTAAPLGVTSLQDPGREVAAFMVE